MAYQSNPFTPSFASMPPILIGRSDVLLDVRDGLREGIGSPLRANKITGPRGVGKTTLLMAASDVALEEGWIPVNVDPSEHMMDEMLDLATERSRHLLADSPRKVASVSAGPVGIGWEKSPAPREPGWRVKITRVLHELRERGSGLLFIVDEVSDRHQALQTFGKRFQNLKSEGLPVALIAAGLPLNVEQFENLKDTTFIRRAVPHKLGEVPIAAVREALRQTFADHGRTIDAGALRRAADATEGYPFLVQLVGYHIWRRATGEHVSAEAVAAGVADAEQRIGETVHSSAVADLSNGDRVFLLAMAGSDSATEMGVIAAAAGWSPAAAGSYRLRLIRAGLIRAVGHGYVDFAVPYLREYLRANADILTWNPS